MKTDEEIPSEQFHGLWPCKALGDKNSELWLELFRCAVEEPLEITHTVSCMNQTIRRVMRNKSPLPGMMAAASPATAMNRYGEISFSWQSMYTKP